MLRSLIAWSRAHRLAAFTLAAGAAALSAPYWAPGVVWIPLACALAGSALLLTRRATDTRAVAWIVGASFGIRCLVALSLFAISSLKLPILPSLHADYGLWAFGVDGVAYHEFAVKVLDAWRFGIDLPSVFIEGNVGYEIYKSLALPMAMVYAIFGPSPLHVILTNVSLGAISGLVAYLLAARLGANERGAIAAGALVAFWPSSIVWSTQLLKDPVVLALDLSALLVLVASWQRYSSSGALLGGRLSADLVRWGGLGAAVFALTYFRSQIGVVLAASVSIVLAAAICRALMRRRWVEALAAAGITVLVGTSTLSAMSLDLVSLVSPANPEIGYVKRGDAFHRQGRIEAAVADYRRAVAFNATYAPAYRGLGATLGAAGDNQGAAAALDTYRRLELAMKGEPSEPSSPSADAAGATSSASAPGSSPASPAPPPTTPAPEPPITAAEAIGDVVAGWRSEFNASLVWGTVDSIAQVRRAGIETGGASLIDSTTFDRPWDVVAYLPRAVANAYLAPFPWQWVPGGDTGIFRSLAGVEVVLIAALVPAMVLGCWPRVRRFRPEEWVLIGFIGGVAIGYGLMMTNGGTLFRGRLQFLFPSLILASSALPPFVLRFIGASAPDEATRSDRPAVSTGV